MCYVFTGKDMQTNITLGFYFSRQKVQDTEDSTQEDKKYVSWSLK